MLVVTSIGAIFSQKKKKNAIKIFAEKQFPRAWEAKVKRTQKI
jgi:hypothetical protein